MHIALIISSLTAGGAERVLAGLANAWVSRGHEISIVILAAPEVSSWYSLDPRINLIHLGQVTRENLSLPFRFRNIIKRIFKLRKTLKALRPDVIISFIDVMNVTTLFASRHLGIPVIVSERTHPFYYQLPAFYKKLRKVTYPWADKVISQTVSASDYFSTLSQDKKSVISNSVKKPSVQKKESDLLKPVRKIVSVGRLCPNKGFHTLILAFSEIVSQNRDLKLTIYGEGTERQNLELLIQQLKLTHHVFLPGAIKDIETALYQSDLFVFPSRYEGFPNALCEAMAIGLPVIASDCSGTIDIIREGVDGRFFPVGDVPRLAALLQELIHNPSQRVKLSKGALAISERYSEDSVLKLWDEVLREVVPF